MQRVSRGGSVFRRHLSFTQQLSYGRRLRAILSRPCDTMMPASPSVDLSGVTTYHGGLVGSVRLLQPRHVYSVRYFPSTAW